MRLCCVGVVVGNGDVGTVAVLFLSAIWGRSVTLHGCCLGGVFAAICITVMTGLVSSCCWAHKEPRARRCRVVDCDHERSKEQVDDQRVVQPWRQ